MIEFFDLVADGPDFYERTFRESLLEKHRLAKAILDPKAQATILGITKHRDPFMKFKEAFNGLSGGWDPWDPRTHE